MGLLAPNQLGRRRRLLNQTRYVSGGPVVIGADSTQVSGGGGAVSGGGSASTGTGTWKTIGGKTVFVGGGFRAPWGYPYPYFSYPYYPYFPPIQSSYWFDGWPARYPFGFGYTYPGWTAPYPYWAPYQRPYRRGFAVV